MSHLPGEPVRGSFPNPGNEKVTVLSGTKREQSLGQLVADAPRLFIGLVKDELEQAKRELTSKGKKLGVAIGLGLVIAFFALTMWALLVTAAVLGLNTVLAPWASALIVAGIFLVLIIILGLVAVASLKKAMPLKPERTLASVEQDINAMKGTGQYE